MIETYKREMNNNSENNQMIYKMIYKKKPILNFFCLLVLALCVIAAIIAAITDNTYAASLDRDPEGSVTMPKNKTLAVEEGKNVKIDFGREFNSKMSQSYYFYKIKVKKTGIIKFTDDFTVGNSLALCDAKKNVISKGNTMFDDMYDYGSKSKFERFINYGVKKGKTYHIRVKGSSPERLKDGYPYVGTVKWKCTAVKAAKCGKNEKKAVGLARNKLKKGLFIAGKRKAQWFKITKNKTKKIKVRLYSKYNCGTILATIKYKSKGKWAKKYLSVIRDDKFWKDSCTVTFDDNKKSTCYIKVYPNHKESGMYQIKWK